MPNAMAAEQTAAPNRHNAVVRRVLSYLDENFTGPVHLNDCAKQVALNPVYLSTLFSRAVGVGFKQYVIALRIEKARELLTDCTRRVSEVAYAVGYTCPNRFFQAFRKATGVSPSEWRVSSQASEETTRKLKFREGETDQRRRH
jgi:two-component system response regulator YesN